MLGGYRNYILINFIFLATWKVSRSIEIEDKVLGVAVQSSSNQN